MAYAVTVVLGISAELPYLRAEAESLMLDRGTASRPTGEGPVYQGGVDVEDTDDLFTSKCKIKPPRLETRQSEAGGRTIVTIPGELHLPATEAHPEYADLTIGDIWTITAVDPKSLVRVGRKYRITSEADGTLVTACRYAVEREAS